jgi:outer membrane protein
MVASLRSALLATLVLIAAPAATLVFAASAARADTLAEAIAAAYASNPELAAERARVRVVDEQVPLALAGGRPALGARLNFDQSGLNAFEDNGRTYTAGANIVWNFYQGGRIRAATNAADNRILAARARLRAAENQLILNTVTAYADVLRFAEVVRLNEGQIAVLDRELQANSDRFEVGDLTRTDVAQSQARLANAKATLVTSQNQLAAARQAYIRGVGRPPENLEPLPPLPFIPGTEGQAVDLAQANNPALLAARFDEAAARYDVQRLQKQRLPTVGTTFQSAFLRFEGGGRGGNFVRQGQFVTQDAILTATMPIWQGGLFGAQIRQGQATRGQLMEQISAVARQTQEQAVNSYNQLRAARATIEAAKVAVDANALASEGVRQENQVGTRTIIEVLNAEQELLNTRVNLATAQRDEQVAAYALLAAAGGAEALALGVPVEIYNPEDNARRVRHKTGDDGDENPEPLPAPSKAQATRSMVIGPQLP